MAVTAHPASRLAPWRTRWAALDIQNRQVLAALTLGVLVFATTAMALLIVPSGAQLLAWWWPAAGLSVGAVALTSGRYRLVLLAVIAVSGLLGTLATGRPIGLAVFFAVADVIEAWVAGTWLSRGRLVKLETLGDLRYLVTVSVVGGILAGGTDAVGVAVLLGGSQWSTLPMAALAHATGVLMVVPLGIHRPVHMAAVRRAEFILQWILTMGMTLFVFVPNDRLPVPFLVLLILVWTSLRQGGRTAAAQLVVVGFLATALTTHGDGPFAGDVVVSLTATSGGAVLQLFLLACTLAVLVVALTAAQREAAVALVSANERFLDAVVETMDVGIVVVDGAGVPILFNRAFREIYGELNPRPGPWRDLGQNDGLFGADGVTPLTATEIPMARVLAGEQVEGVEIVIAVAGRPRRSLIVNGREIRTKDGTLLGGVNALHDVTALKQHEVQLNEALGTLAEEREFEQAVMEVVNAGVLACDAEGTVRVRNATQRQLMGHGGSGPLQRALGGVVITDQPAQVDAPGGDRHDVLISARQVRGGDGRLLGAVAAFTDVTAEKVIEAKLRDSVAFHDALLVASPDVTYISDATTNIPTWISHAVTSTLGFTAVELRAMGDHVLTDLIYPDDLKRMIAENGAIIALADGQAIETRFRIRVKSGVYRWVSRRVTPFDRYEDGRLRQILSVGRDITDTVMVEQRLIDAALHDPLTGLPNRRLLGDRLDVALKRAARSGGEVAVLFCDLDGFKRVNDLAGHAAGDVVLTAAAARLRSVVRPQDTVARVGGDEFVIVVDLNVPGPSVQPAAVPAPTVTEARQQASDVAQRITTALAEPVDINGVAYLLTVSIGITYAQAGDDADGALRDADTAMYLAKARGKHRTEIFNDTLRSDVLERSRIEQVLRAAIADIGKVPSGPCVLSAVYQPIVDLRTQQVLGVEALARLHDAQGVPIEPRVFIPIAEESGLITNLGHYMLQTACRDLAYWHACHPTRATLGVAVNLSAREVGAADLVATVREALTRNGLDGADLTLELTESILLRADGSTMSALRELRAQGVKIDIDDFGTGYGTLRYLLDFPVTGLKIDRSFVTGLPDEPASRTVVRAIASVAHDLDLSRVDEDIEALTPLSAVPAGVAWQGYLLGGPVPAAEIEARLGRNPPLATDVMPR